MATLDFNNNFLCKFYSSLLPPSWPKIERSFHNQFEEILTTPVDIFIFVNNHTTPFPQDILRFVVAVIAANGIIQWHLFIPCWHRLLFPPYCQPSLCIICPTFVPINKRTQKTETENKTLDMWNIWRHRQFPSRIHV